MLDQLLQALNNSNIFEKFQSEFCEMQSTEAAPLIFTNDLLFAADSGACSVLILLDLSSAFDSIDHFVHKARLKQWVGITGSAPYWFSLYLHNRTCFISAGDFTSRNGSDQKWHITMINLGTCSVYPVHVNLVTNDPSSQHLLP